MCGLTKQYLMSMETNKNILLFTVAKHYTISGRGLILSPGLRDNVKHVKAGSKIKLVRPDNSVLQTTISGITFEGDHDILLPSNLTKEDVPVGTEVWTDD